MQENQEIDLNVVAAAVLEQIEPEIPEIVVDIGVDPSETFSPQEPESHKLVIGSVGRERSVAAYKNHGTLLGQSLVKGLAKHGREFLSNHKPQLAVYSEPHAQGYALFAVIHTINKLETSS